MKGLVLLLALVASAAATYLWSGAYDFGADAPHWPPIARLIDYARDRSLDSRASEIAVPRLDDAKMISLGAEHYAEMCVGCHLAPGVDETDIRKGLYPRPPLLADPWPANPAREFWAIKHGVKLSAMPAWGQTHSDDIIWAIVAFLQKLQGMTPEQYAALTNAGEADQDPQQHRHEH